MDFQEYERNSRFRYEELAAVIALILEKAIEESRLADEQRRSEERKALRNLRFDNDEEGGDAKA